MKQGKELAFAMLGSTLDPDSHQPRLGQLQGCCSLQWAPPFFLRLQQGRYPSTPRAASTALPSLCT